MLPVVIATLWATVGATAGMTLLIYLTNLFVIVTPLPLALTGLRRGRGVMVLSLLLALLVLVAFYLGPSQPVKFLPMADFYPHLNRFQVAALGLLSFLNFGWLGLVLATMARKTLSVEKSVGVILGLSLLVPGLLLVLVSKVMGIYVIREFQDALRYILSEMINLQEQSGVSGDEVLFLRQYANFVVEKIIGILPGLWVNFLLFTIGVNALFLRLWASSERPFPSWSEFGFWRLQDGWIWAAILSGGGYFLNFYMIHSHGAGLVILNLLLILGAVYFYQGLSILSFYLKRRFSPLMRMVAYIVFILLIQMVGFFTILLGLFDFWFDFRKLKKVA